MDKKLKDIFLCEEFSQTLEGLHEKVQAKFGTRLEILKQEGRNVSSEFARRLRHSGELELWELRFGAHRGVWRASFVYHSEDKIVFLDIANKKGSSNDRIFAHRLIDMSVKRYNKHKSEF